MPLVSRLQFTEIQPDSRVSSLGFPKYKNQRLRQQSDSHNLDKRRNDSDLICQWVVKASRLLGFLLSDNQDHDLWWLCSLAESLNGFRSGC